MDTPLDARAPITRTLANPTRTQVDELAGARQWVWLIPVLLLAAGLGAFGLNMDAIWSDEFFSIHDAGWYPHGIDSLPLIWDQLAARNPWHAPGFFMLLNGWGRLVGWSVPLLRAFALLWGLLAIAWTYRLGADLVSPRVGFYGAAVLATSAFFTHFMHEIRMYTLLVLLTAFTIWVYLRIMNPRRRPTRLEWLGLLVGATGLIYTQYFGLIPLLVIGLYHLTSALVAALGTPRAVALRRPSWRRWWRVVAVMIGAGLLFVPWVTALLSGLELAAGSDRLHEKILTIDEALVEIGYMFGSGSTVIAWAFVLPALFALRRRGAWKIWFFAVGIVVTLLLVNDVVKVMNRERLRYAITLWVPLSLLVGLSLTQLERWKLRPLAPLLLVVWLAFGAYNSVTPQFATRLDDSYKTFPVQTVAETLRPLVHEDDALVSYLPDYIPFWMPSKNDEISEYYFQGRPVQQITGYKISYGPFQDNLRVDMLEDIGDRARVWLAYSPMFESESFVPFMADFTEHYALCETLRAGGALTIQQYTRADLGVCCMTNGDSPQTWVTYGNGIAVTGLHPLADVPAGESLEAVLGWSVSETVPANTYSVALHVLDDDGTLVAQTDYALPYLRAACKRATIPLTDLAPGDYQLAVIVYAWESGARLSGQVTDSAPAAWESGERVVVGAFRVE